MITNTTNFPIIAYYDLSTIKQNNMFLLIIKLKKRRNFKSYSNICIGRERQILRLAYEREWSATSRKIQNILSETNRCTD